MFEMGTDADGLLRAAFDNAVLVSALAPIVALVDRFARRPALGHRLWLLLLVKLVTPPIVPIDLTLPWPSRSTARPPATSAGEIGPRAVPARPAGASTGPGAVAAASSPGQAPAPAAAASPPRDAAADGLAEWMPALLSAWSAGSILWGAGYLIQFARIRRWLGSHAPAPSDVQGLTDAIAASLGLARAPRAWLVPGRLSPAVWGLAGRPGLIIPEELWSRLDEDQRASLVTHELAHLRRRDHWIRPLEMIVTVLYWWFPVAWWARRSLREAEEQCCDALVLRALPGSRRKYARTLLDTMDFLAEAPARRLVLGIGLGDASLLKSRLVGIMKGTTAPGLSRRGAAGLLGVAGVILPLSIPGDLAPRRYRVMDLGSLGGAFTKANDINDRGEVVGQSETLTDELPQAFRTRPNRPIDPATDLLPVPSLQSIARAINNRGEVLVWATTRNMVDATYWPSQLGLGGTVGARRASYRVLGDRVTPLGTLDERSFPPIEELDPRRLSLLRNFQPAEDYNTWEAACTHAQAINDAGEVVGVVIDNRECTSGFRTEPGRPIDPSRDDFGDTGSRFPRLGSKQVFPGAINARGQVIGRTLGPDGRSHAFRSRPGRPVDLRTDDLGDCWPAAINGRGQVVGSCIVGNGDSGVVSHAFRTPPGRPVDPARDDLGTLGGQRSTATDINDRGEVVGDSELSPNVGGHAFLHDGRGMHDLNDLIPADTGLTILKAHAINNRGQIVGQAEWVGPSSNAFRAVLLTPESDRLPGLIVGLASLLAVPAIAWPRALQANHVPS
ncbi:M56 family metallopeptidase [Aquisphaera insulae]|uniref:M56 family metallopeptidase n=1 Tax=Aquisphaera insulae TaxID=2712864 RepID=UPI0013ED0B0C|nr:M56 family metallopeptidase [Aquisphaera insulae]